MKKILYSIILVMTPIILLFLYDYNKLSTRAEEQKKSKLISLNEELNECQKRGGDCTMHKERIEIENRKEPLISTLFLTWIGESLKIFFENFGLSNIIILMLIIFLITTIVN